MEMPIEIKLVEFRQVKTAGSKKSAAYILFRGDDREYKKSIVIEYVRAQYKKIDPKMPSDVTVTITGQLLYLVAASWKNAQEVKAPVDAVAAKVLKFKVPVDAVAAEVL